MIILDTNVISEMMRPNPDPRVASWLEATPRSALFTTSVTRAELLCGALLLPDGNRKNTILKRINTIFSLELGGKILPFNSQVAEEYAKIFALRKSLGKPISQFDAMIFAITKTHCARLATRNVKDFVDCDLDLINPWFED